MPKKTWNCFIDFKFYLFKFSHTKSVPTLTDEEAKWYDMQSSNTGAFLHRSESNFGEVVVVSVTTVMEFHREAGVIQCIFTP